LTHSRTFRLGDIAARLGGELLGRAETEIRRIATLESAGPGDLSFLTHPRYRSQLRRTQASAVILARAEQDATALPRIVCDDPYLYYARAAQLLEVEARPAPGVHPSAVVEPGAAIAASATVGPFCHIGAGARLGEGVIVGANCSIGEQVRIGDESRLHASVILYPRSILGKRTLVHSGAVIGADGFGMAQDKGRWVKIPQTGRVVIGDDVEIGANTTIDRGALDDTVIEEGVKLDNQIQIGHNVRVGAHTIMAACVGIAGSARIGSYCAIGGGARIWGHIEIADHVNISATAEVMKSITRPGTYTGVLPAAESREWAKMVAHLRGIDAIVGRVREIERRLAAPANRKRKR
jgi:UDP-3-O-[3-hydroxymyristoyl] glucosamine N-acyltransferase